MKEEILFRMKAPFRDDFVIKGFRFGHGEPACAIVGAMRGDEIPQLYTAGQMVRLLHDMEIAGEITAGKEILVIPAANPFSLNTGERFWAMDHTDINRMLPGYDKGETTQRIAAGLFSHINSFATGIQLCSHYLHGDYIPHVRMMKTEFDLTAEACSFELPYVLVNEPAPFDTTTLNYNWHIWGVHAFSLYAGQQFRISGKDTRKACRAMLRFLNSQGITKHPVRSGYASTVIHQDNLVPVQAKRAGIFFEEKMERQDVKKGELLAQIVDPHDGSILERVVSPVEGVVFFAQDRPLVLENTLLYTIVKL